MSFEEYSKREYEALKKYLPNVPEEQLKKYWESEKDYIISAYKRDSRIAYGLALAY